MSLQAVEERQDEAEHKARVERLYVRLARVACELDAVAQAYAAEPLTAEDEDLLAPPAAHLALGYEALAQTLYELEKNGVAPWPPIVVVEERIAA